MAEDKKLTQLVINELTKAQYEALGDNVNEDEIYIITDDEVEIKSDGITIAGNGTTANPLSISPEFIEKVDTEISDRENAISSLEQSINNTINELDEKLTESDDNLQEQIAANRESITNLDNNKVNKSSLGVASGVATLDSNAKVPLSQINDSLIGNVNYQGLYDASTNTPNLDTVAPKGHYYITSVAGSSQGLGLEVGDWIISNGTSWDKVDNTDAVSSVNGRTGNVVITKEDIDLSEYAKFTDYAGQDKAGVIKTSNGLGMAISATGYPLAVTATKSEYDSANTTYFIGKGTLENIKNDLVKRAVTENNIALTDEEKTAARTWIGAGSQTELDTKADNSDTYTKAEVDAKVSSVYRFKGSVATENDLPATNNVTGDVYNVESNGSNYAWDGTTWDKLSETVDLTPYLTKEDASATYATIENLTVHTTNTSNPHNVTAAQVGLGNVNNTSDADKPISTATQSALDEKQDTLTAGTNITITGTTISAKDTTYTAGDGISITDGVISNTRVSAEWGNVTGDITAQEDLQNALTLKANQSTTYTKTEVDNKVKTVDDKVANNAQEIATIKNSKADSSDLSSHTSNTSNPHEVTAAQIGLGNVDNTSDANKPISTATQTALDLKADKSTTYTKSQTDAAIKVVSDNVTTNTANITNLNQSVEALQGSKADTTDLSSHISDVSNPHNVTAEQIGLGNVDNTSDADKPISTATQTALNAKADKNSTYTKAEVDAKVSSVYRFIGSVASVDKLPAAATVGDTYNVEDTGANYAWTGSTWDKLSETIDLTPYLTKSEASTTYETIENVGLHTGNKNNPHGVTKAQVGLGNVDNTSDLAKPISTATQAALDLKANQATTYTKTAVDDLLGEKLDSNTAASTYATIATVTGLENQIEGKLVIIDGQIEELTDTYNAANEHINSTNNPHGVTKAQVGLGNVDNTSDANKPISTATQAALDKKANQATTYTKTEVDNLLDDKLDISTAESTYATKEDITKAGSLPTQTGNAGKYLTTNGTAASWADFPPVATLKQW